MWIRSAWIVLLGARNTCRTEQVSFVIGFEGGVGVDRSKMRRKGVSNRGASMPKTTRGEYCAVYCVLSSVIVSLCSHCTVFCVLSSVILLLCTHRTVYCVLSSVIVSLCTHCTVYTVYKRMRIFKLTLKSEVLSNSITVLCIWFLIIVISALFDHPI